MNLDKVTCFDFSILSKRFCADFAPQPGIFSSLTKEELFNAILNHELMPSMRALMTAGKSADRDNTCVYNCSYLPVDDVKSFDEAMFILLCGTGVGFSDRKSTRLNSSH